MIAQHAESLGTRPLCDVLGEPRSSYYRSRQEKDHTPSQPEADAPLAQRRNPSPRALSEAEQRQVLQTLNSERFRDMAPAEVHATLLDEGIYLCSERTMYRILGRQGQTTERRQQEVRHYTKPELLATKPNELWSWDITKLLGAAKWTYYYLYTILDIFSRYVVGWMVAHRESATLAEDLIAETCLRQGIEPGQLTMHADRGGPMISQTVGQLLACLGITKTHSRPHVSNDNPYSESCFKTLKYRPDFPDRFGSIEDARAFCQSFFHWYNNDHRHSGIAMLTPASVHQELYTSILQARAVTLAGAYLYHPERFVKGIPTVESVPHEVWINKPPLALNTLAPTDPFATTRGCHHSAPQEIVRPERSSNEIFEAKKQDDHAHHQSKCNQSKSVS